MLQVLERKYVYKGKQYSKKVIIWLFPLQLATGAHLNEIAQLSQICI